MNEMDQPSYMTTRELANTLGVDVKTIQRTAEKLFDMNVVKSVSSGGRPSWCFDEEQATAIKIELQNHSEVAKVLNCGMGRNKIFELLRDKGVLNSKNQPYQQFVDMGYFRVIESSVTLPDGSVRINLKTVVFQKGLDFIRKLVAHKDGV